LTTTRSADVVTAVVVVCVLSSLLESLVVVATVAEFEIVDSAETLEFTRTTMEKTADAPGANVELVQLTLPVADPAAGVVQVKVGPLVCVADTNVVLAGTASINETSWAADGPELLTVTV